HDERTDAVGLLESVDLRDVRVIQRRQQPGFALEPCDPIRIGRNGTGQDLDRDIAIELAVPRTIDLAHTAAANRRDDFVRPESNACDQVHPGRRRNRIPLILSRSARPAGVPRAFSGYSLRPVTTPSPLNRTKSLR